VGYTQKCNALLIGRKKQESMYKKQQKLLQKCAIRRKLWIFIVQQKKCI